jgi:hypothetical protein
MKPNKGRIAAFFAYVLFCFSVTTGFSQEATVIPVDFCVDASKLLVCSDSHEAAGLALAMGDYALTNRITASEECLQAIHTYSKSMLCSICSGDARERRFARKQIQRLGILAAPTLIDNLPSMNSTIAEECFQHLSTMRSEQLILDIIERTRNADWPRKKAALVWALGKMTEQRDPQVPGRKCMNESESSRLADTLIRPFLKSLNESETDKDVLAAIERAFKELERAFDGRLKPMDPKSVAELEKLLGLDKTPAVPAVQGAEP